MDTKPTNEDPPEGELYHYTKLDTGKAILVGRTFRLTSSEFLNDSSEVTQGAMIFQRVLWRVAGEYTESAAVRAVVGLLRDDVRAAEDGTEDGTELDGSAVVSSAAFSTYRRRRLRRSPTYVASFTEAGDHVSQWVQYADNATGCALGMRATDLLESMAGVKEGPRPFLMRCLYDENEYEAAVEKRIRSRLMGLDDAIETARLSRLAWDEDFRPRVPGFPRGVFARPLQPEAIEDDCFVRGQAFTLTVDEKMMAPKLKDATFSNEREWRLLSVEEVAYGPVHIRPCRYGGQARYLEAPFRPFPMRLILGPLALVSHPLLKDELATAGASMVTVSRSTSSYRG